MNSTSPYEARLNMSGMSNVYAALCEEQFAPGTIVLIEGTNKPELAMAYVFCGDKQHEVLTSSEQWFGGYLKWEISVRW